MRQVDGVLFVSPEYNRSVPGVPQERHRRRLAALWQERLIEKPAAVVTASPGAIGGFGANHHLRQSCVFLDMPVMQQPEAYLSSIKDEWRRGRPPGRCQGGRIPRQDHPSYAKWVELILQNQSKLAPDPAHQ